MKLQKLSVMLTLVFFVPLFSGCLSDVTEPIGDVPSYTNLKHLCKHTRPALSPDGGYLAYTANEDSDRLTEIWLMNLTTGKKIRIYEEANRSITWSETYLSFSPDGTKIVFNGWCGIFTLSRVGNNWAEDAVIEEIADHGPFPLARYSPDGTKIAVGSHVVTDSVPSGYGNIWVMDSDGTNDTALTTDPCREAEPTFTSDGKNVLYINGSQIWSINLETREQHQVTNGWCYSMPVSTPQGKLLVLSTQDSPHYGHNIGGNSVWIMDEDGTNQTLIYGATEWGNHAVIADISADGTKIVMQLWNSIYIIESPDGEYIWEDSDGDGMADVCDDYPNNPDRGYLKDPDTIPTFNIGLVLIVVVLLAFTVGYGRRTKR